MVAFQTCRFFAKTKLSFSSGLGWVNSAWVQKAIIGIAGDPPSPDRCCCDCPNAERLALPQKKSWFLRWPGPGSNQGKALSVQATSSTSKTQCKLSCQQGPSKIRNWKSFVSKKTRQSTNIASFHIQFSPVNKQEAPQSHLHPRFSNVTNTLSSQYLYLFWSTLTTTES